MWSSEVMAAKAQREKDVVSLKNSLGPMHVETQFRKESLSSSSCRAEWIKEGHLPATGGSLFPEMNKNKQTKETPDVIL